MQAKYDKLNKSNLALVKLISWGGLMGNRKTKDIRKSKKGIGKGFLRRIVDPHGIQERIRRAHEKGGEYLKSRRTEKRKRLYLRREDGWERPLDAFPRNSDCYRRIEEGNKIIFIPVSPALLP